MSMATDGIILDTKNTAEPTVFKLRDKNLLDLFYNGVYDSLNNDKDAKNPLQPYINQALDKMRRKIENTEDSDRVFKSLQKLITDTQSYLDGRENKYDPDFIEYKIIKTLFDWQKELLPLPKKSTLLCGRRSGKSYAMAAIAILHCILGYDEFNGIKKPRRVLMLGLTLGKAREIFWENLLHFAQLSGMLFKANNSTDSIYFSNGSIIQLAGNSNKQEREKLRGTEWSLVLIDEAQSQAALGYLLDNILGPIIAGRDSSIILAGTGSLTGTGKWKSLTESEKYAHFQATMRDNPTIPPGALEAVLSDEFNNDENNITYRREYLAENIIDESLLVYPRFSTGTFGGFADFCVIGLDYGFNDNNAFVPVLRINTENGYKYQEIKSVKFNKSATSDIIEQAGKLTADLMEEYKLTERQILFIADNNDQTTSKELQRNGFHIQNAIKPGRMQQIKDLRAALERGDLLINSQVLKDELLNYIWKYDNETHEIIYETDDEFYHPDCLAALRYAWKYYLLRTGGKHGSQ